MLLRNRQVATSGRTRAGVMCGKGELYEYIQTRKRCDRLDPSLGDRNTYPFVDPFFSSAGMHVIAQPEPSRGTFAKIHLKEITMKTEHLQIPVRLHAEWHGVKVFD